MKSLSFLACIAAMSMLMGTGLRAESITIANSSFEDPVLGTDQFTPYDGTTNNIPGWNSPGFAGVQHMSTPSDPDPGNSSFFFYNAVPDGVNVAFDDSVIPITQNLTAGSDAVTLQAGTYTLTVDFGYRFNHGYQGGQFGLFTAGGTALVSAADTSSSSAFALSGAYATSTQGSFNSLTQGNFSQESFTFTVATGGADIGQQLQVDLNNFGTSPGVAGNFADYDNVSLTFDPAPEPSTWALVGVSLLGFTVMLRRRSVRA